METLERLHRYIDSLQDLQGIVRTMKALSAVSIRQYERAVISLADYDRTIKRGLHVTLSHLAHPPVASAQHTTDAQLGAVVFGSDHGLCGRLNEVIVQQALQSMNADGVPKEQRTILAVGDRVASGFEQAEQPVAHRLWMPSAAARITETVQEILLQVEAWRDQEKLGPLFLFYNRRQETGYQATQIKLLPLDLRRFRELEAEPWPSRRLPTFTMDLERLLETLLHQYLFISIYRACAESLASEHASRLAAMQSAEKNLATHLEEVMGTFRRRRQEAITMELLDVVSGFEAVTSQK